MRWVSCVFFQLVLKNWCIFVAFVEFVGHHYQHHWEPSSCCEKNQRSLLALLPLQLLPCQLSSPWLRLLPSHLEVFLQFSELSLVVQPHPFDRPSSDLQFLLHLWSLSEPLKVHLASCHLQVLRQLRELQPLSEPLGVHLASCHLQVLLQLRKFGYSEHCIYTGAMLSFICILLWFLEIQFWERKFLVLISGDSFWERRFLF